MRPDNAGVTIAREPGTTQRWRGAVTRLGERIDGVVGLPGEPGYAVVQEVFNTDVGHAPAVAVVAAGPADVAAAVRLAGAWSRPVAVQATGHGSPRIPADAVLVSTRRMAGIRIDPAARTARIGAGVRSGDLVREAAAVGLAPIVGASPLVGAVGFTLGGGIGPLGRPHGYAADHVRELEVVTADGTVVVASPEREPDLFWACRGGKGNFGVVTAMTVDLLPVTRLYGGGLYFAADAAPAVLHAYQEWTRSVPEAMTSSLAFLRLLPDVDAVPAPLRGRSVVHLRIAFTGPARDGERLVEPLRGVAPTLLDSVGPMPYTDVAQIHGDPVDPGPYHDRSGLLRDLDAPAADAVLAWTGPGPHNRSDVVEIRHLGGAFARPADNAVGFRDAAFTLFTVARAPAGAVDAVRAHQDGLISAMAPWRTGGPCLSYLGGDEGATERVAAAYEPSTYRRLRQVKRALDPGNTFRANHNIPPA